ncbi:MAG: rhomboid family intramembrane serine protease [Planctomycetota bacterium]
MSEVRMMLWAWLMFTLWAGLLYLRRRTEYGLRYPVSLGIIAASSAVGIARPDFRMPAFAVATTGFVLFLILPGLLVGVARRLVPAGRFAAARRILAVARILLPAAFLQRERELYRDALARPDRGAGLAAFYRQRQAKVSGTYGSRATLALAIGLGAVHLLVMTVGDTRSALTLLTCGASHLPLVREGEWFRVVTAMFLHAGFLHLFFNATSIAVVGRWVEPRLGAARTILVFLLGGLVGNLVSLAAATGALIPVPSVGASGGALALLGALVPLTLSSPRTAERGARLQAALVIIGATLVLGVLEPTLDDEAHLGGLATGAVLGFLFTRRRLPDRWMRTAAVLSLALVGATVVPTARTAARWTGEKVLETGEFTMRYPGFLARTDLHLSRPPLAEVRVSLLEAPHVPAGYAAVPGRPGWFVYRGKLLSAAGFEDEIVYRVRGPRGERMAQIRFLLAASDDRLEEAVVQPIVATFRLRPVNSVE